MVTSGEQAVTLSFDGNEIRANTIDGPFSIALSVANCAIAAYNGALGSVATAAYVANSFGTTFIPPSLLGAGQPYKLDALNHDLVVLSGSLVASSSTNALVAQIYSHSERAIVASLTLPAGWTARAGVEVLAAAAFGSSSVYVAGFFFSGSAVAVLFRCDEIGRAHV